MSDPTLDFYNTNAARYADHERPPNPGLFRFLAQCKPAGKVLELGTGAGVDAAVILEQGFDLDATDGSAELAAIASKRIGHLVRTMPFHELDDVAIYDGIYASASLTHVQRSELVAIIEKIYVALQSGGVVWASFKAGVHEGQDTLGRHYNYLTKDDLEALWRRAAPWQAVETEISTSKAYDGQPTKWAAVTALK